jgi:ABC-type multidrug transport system fused ATPase/permease subunit
LSLPAEIWSVLTPRQRRWVAWAQLLSIVMAFSTVAGVASIAPFFSVLGNPQLIDHAGPLHWLYSHFGFPTKRSFEIALGAGFMALVFIANLINVVGTFAMTKLALWIGADLQSALLAEYLGRPFAFHADTHSSILANNVISETARATNDVLQNVFFLITNIATGALIIVSVMLLNPLIATSMIMVLAGGYILIYLAVRNRILRAGRVQSQFFAEQTKLVDESLGAIREIHILRLQDFFRLAFERSTHALARSAAHIELVAKSPRHIMECVAVMGLVLLALLAGGREEGIGPWLGQLTFLGFAAYRLLPTLQQGFSSIVKIRSGRPGFASIAPDLRRARARKLVGGAADSAWRERPRREIRLEEVSFRYGPERPAAVSRVTLRIPARAAVGIVGANGSGKTTLVDLIAGLLAPGSGRIEVDGIALTDANRTDWQSRIAYVPQDIFLLDTTIEQNVALGVAAGEIDKDRLMDAARLAQLDKFVDTLPDGYDHCVGEQGMRLSGGQRQRIGIARALYTDASVLIMDEATSAQDGLSEQEMMSTLLGLRGRYTIILIAHRLSSVRACDVIFEFDCGEMTASGTYGELLKGSESFRRLADVH